MDKQNPLVSISILCGLGRNNTVAGGENASEKIL